MNLPRIISRILCGGEDIRKALTYTLSVEREPKYVCIISYLLEDVELVNGVTLTALLRKLALKNVAISLVVGRIPEAKTKSRILQLRKLGANVFYNPRAHAKLVLVEGKVENLAIITSANITHGGLYYNYEIGTLLRFSAEDYLRLRGYIIRVIGAEETEELWIRDD